MFTITLYSGQSVNITDEQLSAVFKEINNPSSKFLTLNDGIIAVAAIQSILPKEKAAVYEEVSLINKGFFKCHAGNVHKLGSINDPARDKCECPRVKDVMHPSIKQLIQDKINIKSMPEPSYDEMLISRAESGEKRAKNIINYDL